MSPAAELPGLVDSYLDLWWSMDPVAATAAGVTEHDHRLGTYGADDVKHALAGLKAISSALEGCDAESLDDEIDRTALLGEIRFAINRFEREQPHIRNPAFWIGHALEGLYQLLLLQDRPREHRARAAARRVRAMPGFLETARATLRDCPRVFVETGLQMAEAGFALVGEVSRELIPTDDEEFPTACESAQEALGSFVIYLRDDLLEDANADFAIGEEAFNFRLHHQHALRNTAPELWRYGLALIEEVENDLAGIAREIDAEASWPTLVERLRADHPSTEHLVAAYAEHMERARRFVEERGLVPLPAGALFVVETPPFLRPLVPFAAYQPPGAFADDRTGWFYVTPPDGSADPGRQERMLRDHCVHDLASTALHEGFPGHHLQFLVAHEQPRRVRKVIGTPLTIEGWALYCEEMMAEEGFYAGLEERLFQKLALLWRAARIVADVGLHTRGMPFQEAADLLVDRVHFDRNHAEAEVRRYCEAPAYQLCYAVGRRELRALRDAYRAAIGPEYSLRRFHDAVLSYGTLPVSLIRWGMGLDE